MVELGVFPLHGHMTGFTFATAVSFMIVILEMAGNACAIHLISERILAMAVHAGQLTVTTLEREFRIAAVVKTRIVPSDRIVAVATFIAASAFMRIVILMTGVTISRGAEISRIFVAIETGGFDVNTNQWKIGRIMVETRVLPIGRDMTVDASCTKTLLMNVIFPMAVDAGTASVTMLVGGFVAVNAKRFEMFAIEFEIGKSVVKRLLI